MSQLPAALIEGWPGLPSERSQDDQEKLCCYFTFGLQTFQFFSSLQFSAGNNTPVQSRSMHNITLPNQPSLHCHCLTTCCTEIGLAPGYFLVCLYVFLGSEILFIFSLLPNVSCRNAQPPSKAKQLRNSLLSSNYCDLATVMQRKAENVPQLDPKVLRTKTEVIRHQTARFCSFKANAVIFVPSFGILQSPGLPYQ